MRLYAGTSGFSYKAWKGYFYPEDLPAARMLEYYAEHLPAVEINSTFYRMPRESVLADWASRVPESFSFVLKASRRITHMKRLKDAGDEVAYLYGVAKKLGAHRGPLLFQTPPNLNGFDINLADGANVQSRTRDQVGPQSLNQISLGTPKEGYGIGVGSGVGFISRVFLTNTTGTAGGSTVELQAKVTRSGAEAIGY